MAARVVRPKKAGVSKEATQVKAPEGTQPGDQIELRISMEVPGAKGSGAWVTAGVNSFHREGETSAEAAERIFDFVSQTVQELAAEAER
jgi:hypothetical protein